MARDASVERIAGLGFFIGMAVVREGGQENAPFIAFSFYPMVA
jgi:hypothetical protein